MIKGRKQKKEKGFYNFQPKKLIKEFMGLISHHFHKFHEYSIIPIINLERKWTSIYDLFISVKQTKWKKEMKKRKEKSYWSGKNLEYTV